MTCGITSIQKLYTEKLMLLLLQEPSKIGHVCASLHRAGLVVKYVSLCNTRLWLHNTDLLRVVIRSKFFFPGILQIPQTFHSVGDYAIYFKEGICLSYYDLLNVVHHLKKWEKHIEITATSPPILSNGQLHCIVFNM